MRWRASTLPQALCGVTIKFGMLGSSRILPSFGGSTVSTSVAAPAILPAHNACARAASSTIPPRAQLIRKALDFIASSSAWLIRLRVSSVSGQCKLRKSTCGNNSANGTREASPGRLGNDPIITFIPNASANLATALPSSP